MSHENVIRSNRGQPVDERTSHAIVAAQLRGEASTDDDASAAVVVAAVAREIEDLGLEPDRSELRRRYGDQTEERVSHMAQQQTSGGSSRD